MIMTDLMTVLPEITIAVGVIVVMMADLFLGKRIKNIGYFLAQIFVVLAAWVTFTQMSLGSAVGFGGQTVSTSFTYILQVFIFLVAFFIFIYSKQYIDDRRLPSGDFYTLAMLSILGAVVLVSAQSLLTIYIGLELLSLPLYAMIAIRRDFGKGAEAAIKYFVLGAIASGLLLFGMSFIYGITGSLNLSDIAHFLATNDVSMYHNILMVALVLVVTTAVFKLGAVPFHMWVPDVYEGSPNAVTAYVATIPKVAAFAMLVNLLFIGLPSLSVEWTKVLLVLALISIFFGNIVALAQTNIKRLMGYSTISHIGFILLALTMVPQSMGLSTAIFYVIVYVLMSLSVFGVLIILGKKGYEVESLDDISGLNRRNPWLSFLMMVTMFSMAGIPPFAGFFAKLFVIMGLVDNGSYVIACYALIMSVIAAYYYIRIIKVMYFNEPKKNGVIKANSDMYVALSVNALLLLLLGIAPAVLTAISHHIAIAL